MSFLAGEQCFSMKRRELFGELPTTAVTLLLDDTRNYIRKEMERSELF